MLNGIELFILEVQALGGSPVLINRLREARTFDEIAQLLDAHFDSDANAEVADLFCYFQKRSRAAAARSVAALSG